MVALAHLISALLVFWRLRFITRDLTFRESRASVDALVSHARLVVEAVVQQQAEQQTAPPQEPGTEKKSET